MPSAARKFPRSDNFLKADAVDGDLLAVEADVGGKC